MFGQQQINNIIVMEKYISKSDVVTEIESKKKYAQTMGDNAINGSMQQFYDGMKQSCIDILSFLDTLEVKEVDLGKEYTEEIYSHLDSIKDTADRMTSGNFMHNKAAIKFSANTITKVLELIGLKAQKGE